MQLQIIPKFIILFRVKKVVLSFLVNMIYFMNPK